MEAIPNQLALLWVVLQATLLGAAIGFEREAADKPAGLRTHMLVAAASALLVGLGEITLVQYDAVDASDALRSDPIRILEAVITGVSFLGAGTIIRDRGGVRGLTTAASLLLAAAMGAAVALSQLVLAIGVTILAVLVLRVPRSLERRMKRGPTQVP